VKEEESTESLLARLAQSVACTQDLHADLITFLTVWDCAETGHHSSAVAALAQKLAEQFGEDPQQAEIAGWLHDVSAAIPNANRLEAACAWGLEVMPEEASVPMLLHQRLSAVMARAWFGVTDENVLSAIRCHTTLRAGASTLDKVVFVADKVAWDQPGDPPYARAINEALTRSLDEAAFCYLDHLWQRRETILALHPWLADAYREIKPSVGRCRQEAE
jgi:predicted HD superfamily hydrolase involved in NAD metabolism